VALKSNPPRPACGRHAGRPFAAWRLCENKKEKKYLARKDAKPQRNSGPFLSASADKPDYPQMGQLPLTII